MSSGKRISRPGGFVLVGLLALASASRGGQGIFTPFGPSGGPVSTLAFDAGSAPRVYAGTPSGGVFRSEDGGVTWISTSKGLGTRFGFEPVSFLAADPRRPQNVYAATLGSGVYKTVDGGRNWMKVSNGLPLTPVVFPVWSLHVDPRAGRTVYAGTQHGVYRTTNGGGTWALRSKGMPLGNIRSLAATPDGRTLYAGLARFGVYRSDNGGAGWFPRRNGFPAETTVFALAVDPRTPRILLAGTNRGLFRSTDAGKFWRKVEEAPVVALTFDSAARRFLAATAAGVVVSDDGGATWQPADEQPSDPSISALAAKGNTVLAGTASTFRLGGVFRSSDGGETWAASSPGLVSFEARALAFDPVDPEVLYLGAGNLGLHKSDDGGATWRTLDLGASAAGAFIEEILIDPSDPQTVFAASGRGATTGLFRSLDGGDSWAKVGDFGPLRLTIDPRQPDVVWAAAGSSGLFRSDDGGATWPPVDFQQPGFLNFGALAVDPRDPQVLWLIGGILGPQPFPPTFLPLIFRSLDGGVHWERRDGGFPGRSLVDLALDPADPDRVIVCAASGIYISEDAGASWPAAATLAVPCSRLAAAPATQVLYASRLSPANVFRSEDGGETWTSIRLGLGARPVNFVVVDPHQPNRLVAGTDNGGLWTYTQP